MAGLSADARSVTTGGAGVDADLCRRSADESADLRHFADPVRHAVPALAGWWRCAAAVVDAAGGGVDRPVYRLLHLHRWPGVTALVSSAGLFGLGHVAQRLAVPVAGTGA